MELVGLPEIYITPFVVVTPVESYPVMGVRQARDLASNLSGITEATIYEWNKQSKSYVRSAENNRVKESVNIKAIVALTHLQAETKKLLNAYKHKEFVGADDFIGAVIGVCEIFGLDASSLVTQELETAIQD